jgi:hypothetical protein
VSERVGAWVCGMGGEETVMEGCAVAAACLSPNVAYNVLSGTAGNISHSISTCSASRIRRRRDIRAVATSNHPLFGLLLLFTSCSTSSCSVAPVAVDACMGETAYFQSLGHSIVWSPTKLSMEPRAWIDAKWRGSHCR